MLKQKSKKMRQDNFTSLPQSITDYAAQPVSKFYLLFELQA